MSRKVKSKRVMSVALSKRAENVLVTTKKETGITHLALIERVLEWFAVQDPRIRTMILSPYAEVRRGLARLVTEDMAADPAKDFDPGLLFHGLVHNDYEPLAHQDAGARAGDTQTLRPKTGRSRAK
jgi:hypothetical protein